MEIPVHSRGKFVGLSAMQALPLVVLLGFAIKLPAQVTVVGTPLLTTADTDTACRPNTSAPPVTRFLSTDPFITLRVRMAGLTVGDTILVVFTDPKGDDHQHATEFPVKISDELICVSTSPSQIIRAGAGSWAVWAHLKGQTAPLFPMIAFTVQAAGGQTASTAAAPPMGPDPASMSLEDTMNAVVDTINSIGRMEYKASNTNNAGIRAVTSQVLEKSNARANTANCRLDYHLLKMTDGVTTASEENWFLFRNTQKMQHGTSGETEPRFTFIRMVFPNGSVDFGAFDEAVVTRLGKLLSRAANLCGAKLE